MSTITLKEQFNSFIKKINPISGMYGRAFKMDLSPAIDESINNILNKLKYQISRQEFKAVEDVLNKNDKRDFLTLFAQKSMKDNGKDLGILISLKLATVSTILPIKNHSLLAKMRLAIPLLESVAVEELYEVSQSKAQELFQIFNDYSIDADVKNWFGDDTQKIDAIRLLFWSRLNRLTKFYSSFIDEEYKDLFVQVAKYQCLFNETTAYINNPKKSKTIVNVIEYDKLSSRITEIINNLVRVGEKYDIKWMGEYITHISETSERIRLADLPPLTKTGMISMGVSYLLILFWSFVILFPLIAMILNSFDGTRVNRLGESPSVNLPFYIHYKQLFSNTQFNSWLKNSLFVALWTMLIVVLGTTTLAYSFSRFKFRGKKSSIMTIMLLQMVPSIAALTAFLIMFQIANVKISTFLIIIYSGGALTGNTFILKGYFDSIPVDLDEAAKIDGSSNIKTFVKILIPLARPMIALVALWSFIGPFGDVILPNLLSDKTSESIKHLTMAAGLRTLVVSESTGGSVFQYEYLAGAVITSIPITIMFILAQKFLVSGLTSGAVK